MEKVVKKDEVLKKRTDTSESIKKKVQEVENINSSEEKFEEKEENKNINSSEGEALKDESEKKNSEGQISFYGVKQPKKIFRLIKKGDRVGTLAFFLKDYGLKQEDVKNIFRNASFMKESEFLKKLEEGGEE